MGWIGRIWRRLARAGAAWALLWALVLAAPVAAQNQTFVINLRDTDIAVFAEQVSTLTGRTLILDPAVRGTVTVISAEPLDPDGVWALFQAVLRVQGYAALRSGTAWRVVPQAAVAQGGAALGGPGGQDLVTRLIRLGNLPSEQAVRVLRPLVASFGVLEAIPQPNALIVTDTAENVDRVQALAASLDTAQGDEVGAITLRYAGAAEVAQVIEEILGAATGAGPRIAADERSNMLIVRTDPYTLGDIRALAASLDTPSGVAPTTRVFRLRNSDAQSVTQVLRGVLGLGGQAELTSPVARSLSGGYGADGGLGRRGYGNDGLPYGGERVPYGLGRGASPYGAGIGGGGPQRQVPGLGGIGAEGALADDGSLDAGLDPTAAAADGDVAIQAAVDLNAIVVRGPPAAIAEIGALIAELDVRRPQVMIEAAIVEITGDVSEQLGVQFGVGDAALPGNGGATSFGTLGLSLQSILRVLGAPAAVGLLGNGATAAFTIGDDFSVLIQALASSTRANLLSTPSLTTVDNQVAEIVVGQNVPFRTGTFASASNSTDPFTTIERQDVGITLRVVPQIREGDVLRLQVSQEVSSLVDAIDGAADLVTNRRSIETTVLADNGETIVLGGLITDDRLESDSRVPILGDVPVLGRLFRADRDSRTKRTLFVFLRPTILRNRTDAARVAQGRYDQVRRLEAEPVNQGSLLFDDAVQKLPLELEGIY